MTFRNITKHQLRCETSEEMLDSTSITHKFHLSTRVSVAGSDVRRTPMAAEVGPTMATATSTMRRSGKKNKDEYVVSPERLHRARTSAAAEAHRQRSVGPPTSSSLLRETQHLHGGAEEGPTYIEQQESDSIRFESPILTMEGIKFFITYGKITWSFGRNRIESLQSLCSRLSSRRPRTCCACRPPG